MPSKIKLSNINFTSVKVSEHNEWTFAEISDSLGSIGLVEITCGKDINNVVSRLSQIVKSLKGKEISKESQISKLLGLKIGQLSSDRVLAISVSALRTAVTILKALYKNVSLTRALGGKVQQSVPLYANINRALFDKERTPKNFAMIAERAAREGFSMIKCAPFDEVIQSMDNRTFLENSQPGLMRIAAIREAVGFDIKLLIDCHSRFNAKTAPIIAEELNKMNVYWFEEPLQPTTAAEKLTGMAKKVTIPIAGGERGYGENFFSNLLKRKAVKIIMPDVKYCGGAREALEACQSAPKLDGFASLHNPSGPVSQLISAHVTAALMPEIIPLEYPVFEVSWRSEVLLPFEEVKNGRFWLSKNSGLGAKLNYKIVKKYGKQWRD